MQACSQPFLNPDPILWLVVGFTAEGQGDGEGQGSLVRCSPWCHKESDTTEQLNNNNSKGFCAEESAWKNEKQEETLRQKVKHRSNTCC